MEVHVKLWDCPQLAKSFREYQGLNTLELINVRPDIITWHVKNHNWVLSDVVKAEMATKKKAKA